MESIIPKALHTLEHSGQQQLLLLAAAAAVAYCLPQYPAACAHLSCNTLLELCHSYLSTAAKEVLSDSSSLNCRHASAC